MADYARGQLLRDLRASTHRSRENIAAEIGVTTKTLYEWENGGKIKWENAKKIAAFYEIDPELLVARDEDEAEEEAPATPDLSRGSDQLDRIEAKLDEIISLLHGEVPRDKLPGIAVTSVEKVALPTGKGTTARGKAGHASRKSVANG
jgi:transcriptional regulator with XRE-family HTH domain